MTLPEDVDKLFEDVPEGINLIYNPKPVEKLIVMSTGSISDYIRKVLMPLGWELDEKIVDRDGEEAILYRKKGETQK